MSAPVAHGADAGRASGPVGVPEAFPRSRMSRWLREPLLQFLLAGFALFAVYRALHPAAFSPPADDRIVITRDDLRQMSVVWLAQGRQPPTPAQIASLVEAKVREEVLFREALALGLDKNDTIVKRRLVQKMDFLAEDLASLGEPGRDELKAWFDANRERFARAPRASFRHLYFSPDRRGARTRDDAVTALAKLRGRRADAAGIAALGDQFMFQDYYPDRSFDQIATAFGPQFAKTLFDQVPGAWQGPVESGLGWHVVWIDELQPMRVPPYEEIEAEVKQEWIAERRDEAKRRSYEAMRARYTIVLPDETAPGNR